MTTFVRVSFDLINQKYCILKSKKADNKQITIRYNRLRIIKFTYSSLFSLSFLIAFTRLIRDKI